MLIGKVADIGVLAPCRLFLSAVWAAELEVERALRRDGRQTLEAASHQDRGFQRQLWSKADLDFLGARRRPALVVDQRRAARAQYVDAIGARRQGELSSGAQREHDLAWAFDQDAQDLVAAPALEIENE